MKNDMKNELLDIISKNPDLPVIFLASNDDMCDGWGYTVMKNIRNVKVTEVWEMEKFGDYYFTDDKRDVIEYFSDYLADEDEYKDLSDDKYVETVENYVDNNVTHYNAIVVTLDN